MPSAHQRDLVKIPPAVLYGLLALAHAIFCAEHIKMPRLLVALRYLVELDLVKIGECFRFYHVVKLKQFRE